MLFSHPAFDFKLPLFAISIAALMLGLWITSAELLRHHDGIGESIDTASSAALFRADLAARIGLLRGDLWADDALLHSRLDVFRSDIGAGSFQAKTSPQEMQTALAAAERALSLSPLDSRAWLLVAAQDPNSPLDRDKAASALEMAYLTGQRNTELLPARLMIAVRSGALSRKTIQDFVQTDIDLIFAKLPGLKDGLRQALGMSRGTDRTALEHMIAEADSAFLQADKLRQD